jgi:hypothetical protein
MIRPLTAAALYLIGNIGVACDLTGGETIELDSDITLHYRTDPSPLRVAQHFSMQFRACRAEQSLKLDAFKVDALMPKHGHGMNYKANIEMQRDGLYEATGMLFHMSGQWQIRINLSYDGHAQQVKVDYQI